jgi:hypothetical protein
LFKRVLVLGPPVIVAVRIAAPDLGVETSVLVLLALELGGVQNSDIRTSTLVTLEWTGSIHITPFSMYYPSLSYNHGRVEPLRRCSLRDSRKIHPCASQCQVSF